MVVSLTLIRWWFVTKFDYWLLLGFCLLCLHLDPSLVLLFNTINCRLLLIFESIMLQQSLNSFLLIFLALDVGNNTDSLIEPDIYHAFDRLTIFSCNFTD